MAHCLKQLIEDVTVVRFDLLEAFEGLWGLVGV
jgi:hypothetical protein